MIQQHRLLMDVSIPYQLRIGNVHLYQFILAYFNILTDTEPSLIIKEKIMILIIKESYPKSIDTSLPLFEWWPCRLFSSES